MSDKSGNAEKVRDFLQKNRKAHEDLKDLQEEADMLNMLDHDQAAEFSIRMVSSMGNSIYIDFGDYGGIVNKALKEQMELVDGFKKRLERMANFTEDL